MMSIPDSKQGGNKTCDLPHKGDGFNSTVVIVASTGKEAII